MNEALNPPRDVIERLQPIADLIATRSSRLGRRVEVDPLERLTERATIAGLTRRGAISCGGATRLLPTADGWIAVTLARPDDIELVPAWLELEREPVDPWPAVEVAVVDRPAADVVARGRLLGLPVAELGEVTDPLLERTTDLAELAGLAHLPVRATRLADGPPTTDVADLVVVDLSSLWAGPLCGSLLVAAGADVIKVESVDRPDGARRGPHEFFDRMNAGKRGIAVDLRTADGRDQLARLIGQADVVIEGSRPRALEQLGIDATAAVQRGGPRVWVSISGYGRSAPGRDWVAFGDDAAVAGGLAVWDDGVPCFCADAVADPASGLVATAAVLEVLATGGGWLVDVAMAGVAAHLAGPTRPLDASAISRADTA